MVIMERIDQRLMILVSLRHLKLAAIDFSIILLFIAELIQSVDMNCCCCSKVVNLTLYPDVNDAAYGFSWYQTTIAVATSTRANLAPVYNLMLRRETSLLAMKISYDHLSSMFIIIQIVPFNYQMFALYH